MTETIKGFASGTIAPLTFKLHANGLLAKISFEGKVEIDWRQCEKVVSDPLSDTVQLAYARLMIAIRDKTYTDLNAALAE